MDSELVSGSLPEKSGGDLNGNPLLLTYTQTFEKLCPYYMSMGMTYEQYWEGDPQIAKYTRLSQKLINKRKNSEMWLMGAYIYEAICYVSPILNSNAKKGTKPIPWRKRPIPITKEDEEEEKLRQEKEKYEKNKKIFQNMMVRNNKRFESR